MASRLMRPLPADPATLSAIVPLARSWRNLGCAPQTNASRASRECRWRFLFSQRKFPMQPHTILSVSRRDRRLRAATRALLAADVERGGNDTGDLAAPVQGRPRRAARRLGRGVEQVKLAGHEVHGLSGSLNPSSQSSRHSTTRRSIDVRPAARRVRKGRLRCPAHRRSGTSGTCL
jgi:hypothetical protein